MSNILHDLKILNLFTYFGQLDRISSALPCVFGGNQTVYEA